MPYKTLSKPYVAAKNGIIKISDHKTWKVICMEKSTGTTDENLKLPSPLHAILKTSKDLA